MSVLQSRGEVWRETERILMKKVVISDSSNCLLTPPSCLRLISLSETQCSQCLHTSRPQLIILSIICLMALLCCLRQECRFQNNELPCYQVMWIDLTMLLISISFAACRLDEHKMAFVSRDPGSASVSINVKWKKKKIKQLSIFCFCFFCVKDLHNLWLFLLYLQKGQNISYVSGSLQI